MAQTRYVNFGDTVLAQRINEISTALVVPAVLSGADLTPGLGDNTVDVSPHKVMLNDILLIEDATINLVVKDSLPTEPTDYSIVYEHNNQQVQGGVPAILLVREGLIGFDSSPDTVVIGWIRWPGTGSALQQEMFIEAPKLQITNPSIFPSDTFVPPFVPRMYLRSETPGTGATVLSDVFDLSAFESGGATAIGAAHLLLDNTSASINTITHLFPSIAGPEAPNRIIIEANVPLGGTVSVSLIDEEGNEYLPVSGGSIANTGSLYEFREVQILNVDATKFTQNTPFYVQIITQLNPGKQAMISILGTSSNFLPV